MNEAFINRNPAAAIVGDTNVHSVEIVGTGVSFRCADGDTLVRAALRAGVPFPYECNVGQCGSCRCDIRSGEFETLWQSAPALTPRDRRKGKHLACQTSVKGDLSVQVRLDAACRPHVTPKVRAATLIDARDVTYDMREYRFKTACPAVFLPGQYSLMHLPGVQGERAYSMSNNANEQGEWHFLIKRVPGGQGTTCLFERLKPGDQITMDGPYGLAYLREDVSRDIVCVAGGSGLSPLIAIARAAVNTPSLDGRRISFFFGGRGPADICGEEFLRLLPGFGDRITYHAAISMPELDPRKMWVGPVGFIHEQVEQLFGDDISANEYYLAGPPPMLQATLQMLAFKNRVPVDQIHFDRFF